MSRKYCSSRNKMFNMMFYMKQNKKHKQTLESAQYGLEISFNISKAKITLTSTQCTSAIELSMVFLLLIKGLRFRSTKTKTKTLVRKRRPYVKQKELLTF